MKIELFFELSWVLFFNSFLCVIITISTPFKAFIFYSFQSFHWGCNPCKGGGYQDYLGFPKKGILGTIGIPSEQHDLQWSQGVLKRKEQGHCGCLKNPKWNQSGSLGSADNFFLLGPLFFPLGAPCYSLFGNPYRIHRLPDITECSPKGTIMSFKQVL